MGVRLKDGCLAAALHSAAFPHELYIAACPPIHPAFPCANSPHWILILFLMGSVLPTQYTIEYI